MAFITPLPATHGASHARATSTKPIRLTSFLPRQQSALLSSWPNALKRPSSPPQIFTFTTNASMSVATASKPNILISGAPASGKGTQCELIVEKYGVVHISTGDMLRAAVKAGTQLGVEAKSYMDTGKLVPDDLVISMLKERITQPDCVENGWLLDGFPRTAVQAQALDDAGILPSSVLVLDVNDDVLIERVVGRRSDPVTGKIYHTVFSPATDPEVIARLTQRSDDTEEKARVRLATYYTHAQSIQDHYGYVLRKVDGNRPKSEVFEELVSIIDTTISSKDDTDTNGTAGGDGLSSTADPDQIDLSGSTQGMAVSEFVRRAEEAYEKGLLTEENVNWSGQAAADSATSDGTSSYGDLLRRLDLVFGDVFALLSFAYIGRVSHGNTKLDYGVISTATPFIAAWLAASPLLGAYTRAATANVGASVKTFSKAWAVSIPMGLGLRGMLN